MIKPFIYDNSSGNLELNQPELLLIKEFADLIEPSRNKCKEDPKGQYKLRAFREFTYIYLAIDWSSPYNQYSDLERHAEALRDAKITEEEFNNPEFRAACRKYRNLLDSNRSVKLLKAALNTVDNFIDYFNTIVDLNERDANGKPIFKVKDVQAEMSSLSKVLEELQILESKVKSEMMESTNIRGGAEDGFEFNG